MSRLSDCNEIKMPGTKRSRTNRHTPVSQSIEFAADQIEGASLGRKSETNVLPEFQSQWSALQRKVVTFGSDSESFHRSAADAWHATYGTHVSRAIAQHSAADFMVETVIGDDDRILIQSTNEYPFSAICSLEITASTGRQFVGTGWLVDENTVVTAGHCVFLPDQGGWAKRIRVFPGRNGQQSRDSFLAIQLHSCSGWTQDRRPAEDYGAITIRGDASEHGSLGYVVLKDDDVVRNVYHLVGYPADKPLGTLWGHVRPLKQARRNVLIYETDTYGGNSGCPVFAVNDAGEVFVVGIHTQGDISGNSATRITDEVFENIQQWSR
ncbi:trypsin-like peptidase domain-containing protein [Stieleria sp. TO1_6]|uniref:trypsin-like serine peptidase n=1 Tax=Stieleria tagensis TaxID=2956795 RepID=UPI00209B9275|nr:trypsin-like peptidase domain-containing protein [Stieleria tagensis]MCO8123924.1 trypsin-like peptidase domain-containing protein [Stieleria tagensis]